MILPILSYGAPVLRKEGEDFDENTSLVELIDNMFETMYAASGVGLAGPQIGISKRIFIVDGSPFAEPDENKEIDDELLALKDFKKAGLKGVVLKDKQNIFLEKKKCINFATKNKMFILVK